jgi:hypothetical protein
MLRADKYWVEEVMRLIEQEIQEAEQEISEFKSIGVWTEQDQPVAIRRGQIEAYQLSIRLIRDWSQI